MSLKLEKFIPLFQRPDWPLIMRPHLSPYFYEDLSEDQKTEKWRQEKIAWINLVITLLQENKICLAEKGQNEDIKWRPIDTIVIHHSHSDKLLLEKSHDEIIEWINALQLLRLNADYASNPKLNDIGELIYEEEFNKTIYSGHYCQDKQNFIAYHWFVFPNGSKTQINQDKYFTWHAGSKVNPNSISICLLGDFTNESPNELMLNTTKELIAEYRSKYLVKNIIGHGEVMSTSCPGQTFYGNDGWKNAIIAR